MVPKGIKFAVERKDGEVTTWYDVFNRGVEEILLEVCKQKGWHKGKVLEAYIEFEVNGLEFYKGYNYYKVHLDCKRLTKILALTDSPTQ